MQGGDSRWLLGLDYVPPKLRALSELDKLMAHRPWLIKPAHISALTKGGQEDNWCLPELTQALVLLAHFHSLSSLVHGCGITDDIPDDPMRPRSMSMSSTTSNQSTQSNQSDGGFYHNESSDNGSLGIEDLMEKMKLLTDDQPSEMSLEEIAERFDKVENLMIELSVTSKHRSAKDDLLRYMDDPDYCYLQFSRQHNGEDGQRVQTFLTQDFSWEDQGYSVSNRLYMESGSMLDIKFNIAQQLTYNMCGHMTKVDTTVFRRAVWNFIHCLYGIRHDDYDYATVSQLVDKGLRAYIKLVACQPDCVGRTDYNSILTEDFLQSEKVHINILVMEARMQAELLYSLRAISKHMT